MDRSKTIYEDVRELLVQVLDVDPAAVTPSANFFSDLGGESIDVLDLGFRCERKYGVPIRFQDLVDPDQLGADQDGEIDSAELERLQQRFPFLDLALIQSTPGPRRLQAVFTVDAIVHCVESVLVQHCNHQESPSADTENVDA